MKTLAPMIAFALLTGAPGAAAGDNAKPGAMSVNPAEIKWGDAPPDLPKGAEMAVLHGDPGKKAVYTLRLKLPAGYKIPPHWHTKDEQLTIVSGTFVLHMGDTMDAPATTLTAGGFHFLPGKMHHGAEATGETVVQVDGMGPFDIHYLNPADNPNPPSSKAAAMKK
jgi:quercetin dioxygenase-like cupin family protein